MIRPITCPICKKPLAVGATDEPHFPFCSPRCKQVDLIRWSDGKYAIIDPLTPDTLAEQELADEEP